MQGNSVVEAGESMSSSQVSCGESVVKALSHTSGDCQFEFQAC